jgi:hypothetical protein
MKKLILVTVFVFLGAAATQAQVVSYDCDSSLWPRVYNRYRFAYPVNIKNKNEPPHRCVQIRGTIDHVTPVSEEGDGDIHISVVPDNKGVLRAGQTFLVLEIICADNTPDIGPAKTPCKNYHIPPHLSYSRVSKFRKGQHVQIIGELVIDYLHLKTGWTEIHPVSKIDPIP